MFLNNELHLKITGTKAVLALNPVKRIPFFLIFIILSIGLSFSERSAPRMWIPALMAVLSLLGGLYSEKWDFDTVLDTVVYFRGLPFLGKKIIFPLSSIEEIRFTHLDKHVRKQRSALAAFLKNGKQYNLDFAYGRTQTESLHKRGQLLAGFCNRPLTEI